MTDKELIQFLKKNLTVEVSHPEHVNGYWIPYMDYSTYMEPDEHNITVEIKLCGELICKDTSYLC